MHKNVACKNCIYSGDYVPMPINGLGIINTESGIECKYCPYCPIKHLNDWCHKFQSKPLNKITSDK